MILVSVIGKYFYVKYLNFMNINAENTLESMQT